MNVCDIMTGHPITIGTDRTLAEAIAIMGDLSCHHLPVLSDQEHLIGVLSIHDCEQALGESINKNGSLVNAELANATPVSLVMTPAPIIVEPDAPAYEAARLMLEHYIGCLPVMRGETLVGIITRSDLLMAFMALSQRAAHQACP